MRFAVIVRVPPGPDKGNLALVLPVFRDIGGVDEPALPVLGLSLRAPVFSLGEVLILGEDGRELTGHGRKPSKWDVGVEIFDTVEAAVERAQKVEVPIT